MKKGLKPSKNTIAHAPTPMLAKNYQNNTHKNTTKNERPRKPYLSPCTKFVQAIGKTVDYLTNKNRSIKEAIRKAKDPNENSLYRTECEHTSRTQRSERNEILNKTARSPRKLITDLYNETIQKGSQRNVRNMRNNLTETQSLTTYLNQRNKSVNTSTRNNKNGELNKPKLANKIQSKNPPYEKYRTKRETPVTPVRYQAKTERSHTVNHYEMCRFQDAEKFITNSVSPDLGDYSPEDIKSSIADDAKRTKEIAIQTERNRVYEMIEKRIVKKVPEKTDFKNYQTSIPIKTSPQDSKSIITESKTKSFIPNLGAQSARNNTNYSTFQPHVGKSIADISRLEKERKIINAILEQEDMEKGAQTTRKEVMQKIADRIKFIDMKNIEKAAKEVGVESVEYRNRYWKKSKDLKLEDQRMEKSMDELNGCTFKPEISPLGKTVMREKNENSHMVSKEEIQALNTSNSYAKINEVMNRMRVKNNNKDLNKTQGVGHTKDFISMLANDIRKETERMLVKENIKDSNNDVKIKRNMYTIKTSKKENHS